MAKHRAHNGLSIGHHFIDYWVILPSPVNYLGAHAVAALRRAEEFSCPAGGVGDKKRYALGKFVADLAAIVIRSEERFKGHPKKWVTSIRRVHGQRRPCGAQRLPH